MTRAGKNTELTSKEYALPEYMLRNRGVVLTREMIENNLWNYDYEGGTFTVTIQESGVPHGLPRHTAPTPRRMKKLRDRKHAVSDPGTFFG